MALKDWTKVKDKYKRIVYKRKGQRHRLYIGEKDHPWMSGDSWYIVYNDKHWDFMTKEDALSFANEYMENH